jgi:hypothetical protein
MKGHKKLFLFLLLALCIFIIFFLVFCKICSHHIVNYCVKQVTGYLDRNYDIKIYIEDLTIRGFNIRFKGSFFYGNTLYSANLVNYSLITQKFEILQNKWFTSDHLFLQCEKVTGELKLLPIIKMKWVISNLHILSPELYLDVDENGKLIFPETGKESDDKSEMKYRIDFPGIEVTNGYLKLPDFIKIELKGWDGVASVDYANRILTFDCDMKETGFNYKNYSFMIDDVYAKGEIKDKVLTFLESKLSSGPCNMELLGNIDFDKDPRLMNLQIDGGFELAMFGRLVLENPALDGYASFNSILYGDLNHPDIMNLVKVKKGYYGNIEFYGLNLPMIFSYPHNKTETKYLFQIFDGNFSASGGKNSWMFDLDDVDLELALSNDFNHSIGHVKTTISSIGYKDYSFGFSKALASLRIDDKSLQLPQILAFDKNGVSTGSGYIDFKEGVNYSFSYNIKPQLKTKSKMEPYFPSYEKCIISGIITGDKSEFGAIGSASLEKPIIYDEQCDEIGFDYHINNTGVSLDSVNLLFARGCISGKGSLSFSPDLILEADLNFDDVDLSYPSFLKTDLFHPAGILRGNLYLYSKNFNIDQSKLKTDLKILNNKTVDESFFDLLNLDAKLSYDSGSLSIDNLKMSALGFESEINGKMKSDETVTINVTIKSDNKIDLSKKFAIPVQLGLVDIRGSVGGKILQPDLDLKFNFKDIVYGNLNLESLTGNFSGSKGIYNFIDSKITRQEFQCDLSGNLNISSLDGKLDFQSPDLNGNIKISGMRYKKENISDIALSYSLNGDDLKCWLYTKDNLFNLIFELNLQNKLFDSQVSAEKFEALQYMKPFLSETMQDGLDSINLSMNSKVSGTIGDSINTRGNIEIGSLAVSKKGIHFANIYPIKVSINGSALEVSDFIFVTNRSRLYSHLSLDNFNNLDAKFYGKLSLDDVNKLVHFDQNFDGLLDFSCTVKGPMDNLVLNGDYQIDGGSYEIPTIFQVVEDIKGKVIVRNNNISIKSMNGSMGSGKIGVHGELDLSKMIYDFSLNLTHMKIDYPEGVTSTSDGNINIKGNSASMLIAGDVKPSYFKYSKPINRRDWLLQLVKRKQQVIEREKSKFLINYYIKFKAPGNIWFDSSFTKIEFDTDVILQGSKTNPILLGRINLLDGFISLKEIGFDYTNFEVSEGTIDFINPSEINPVCDIRCETNIDDIRVYMMLTGPASELSLKFESDPYLDDNSLLYLLAMGKTPGSSKQTAGINLDSAASLFIGNLKDTIVKKSESALPVDEIEVEPIVSGTERSGGLRVTTTKTIDKLKVVYSIILGTTEEDRVYVEYKLNDMIFLTGVKTEEGGIGGGVKLRISF